ncbi:MAG: hypothetical protein R6V50_02110, partial [Thermoplasmatota archaeon]
MKKRNILKGAGVLLIAAIMILSTLAVTADTNNEQKQVGLFDEVMVSSTSVAAISLENNQPKPLNRAVLWDQYDTDGSNGLSHAPQSAFGFQRALLDDFEIPAGETWTLTNFHSFNLWNTLAPGSGTDFHLEFWSDNAGSPGSLIAAAVTVSYAETGTGRTWFSRPEFEIEYVYEPIVLTEGTYWIWGHVDGPENCFWMARSTIWGSECWLDYEDYPPLQPGQNLFGSPYDLAFQLTGEGGDPPELIPDLDCAGSLNWADVEPGSTVNGTFTVSNVGDAGSLLDWEIQSY